MKHQYLTLCCLLLCSIQGLALDAIKMQAVQWNDITQPVVNANLRLWSPCVPAHIIEVTTDYQGYFIIDNSCNRITGVSDDNPYCQATPNKLYAPVQPEAIIRCRNNLK